MSDRDIEELEFFIVILASIAAFLGACSLIVYCAGV